jgi:hypothetical protein
MLRAIDRRQDAVAIELAEGAGFKLGPRMSHRSAGNRLKELALGQLIQKLVQMALDGLDGLLQHKKHQQRESQLPLAGKVLRPHAMASQELWIAQLSTQSGDQCNEVTRNIMSSRLHPQVNGDSNAKVQPKSLFISMLRMYANTMSPNFTGSAPPPSPLRKGRGGIAGRSLAN